MYSTNVNKMCARVLACPLCFQPGFLTLDALRAGLVSVATRPLVCPVCNEVLLGIDKLTIHLFGHTIDLNNDAVELSKHLDTAVPHEHLLAAHNAHHIASQDWNVSKMQQLGKIQIQSGNTRTCTELSNFAGGSSIENKISTMDLQSETRNQDVSMKNVSQRTLMSDYNYDAMKINILPQPSEDHNTTLRLTADLQGVLKTCCLTQYPCNNNIKHTNVIQENAQTEKPAIPDFTCNWPEKSNSEYIATTKVAETTDANIYEENETRSIESNSNQNITKERLMISLINKEDELSNLQSIQNTAPICTDILLKKCDNNEDLHNAKETALENNVKNQDQNLQECKKTLTHAQTFTKIFQTVTPKERMERCNICGFHFPDTNILALHQQLVHEQDSNSLPGKVLKNYSCHLCSKVFKMRGSLMVHMRVAHTGHNLGSLSKADQIELAHGDAGYNCPTCGKKFKKEQHVIQHMKIHDGKQWECDTCSKMFTTKYFLKKHKRLHSGEMPYKCKICDKNFTFQQSYHKHRLYHKDDKPHTCATCGRSFKELSTLHNHERIHTGEKPFACETCGKCFRQRVSYLVHRRIHTGVMPYKCTMCGKSFRYKVSQRTHKCPAQTSGNIQQLSDTLVQETNNDTVRPQMTNTLQKSQPMINTIDNEENKFILMINAQGQHILTLQSEINNVSSKRKEHAKLGDVNKNSKNKTWNTDNLNPVGLEESLNSIKKVQSDHEKVNIKNTNDLFSLVMSRLDNSMSSPTFEMEHLRVSSPKQKESIDSYADFPQIPDDAQMNMIESSVGQSPTRSKDISDSLQTINVESLKELLYGMDRK